MPLRIDWTLGRTVVKLAYPIAIAMLAQTAVNLMDTIMVGRLAPEYSIAGQSAIAISLILLWGIGGLIASISVGTQALASRRFGEGDPAKTGQVLDNALLIGAIASVVVTVLCVAALPWFFPLLHQDPAVVQFGVEYCTYRFLGIPSMVVTMALKGWFDGVGRTKVHMVAAITMNVMNILLNWVLIFGVGPFPQMYVGGAGLASMIATYIGLAIMMWAAFAPPTRREFFTLRRGSFHWPIAKSIIRIGLPGGLGTLFVMTGFAAFIGIVGRLDTETMRGAIQGLPFYAELTPEVFGRPMGEVWNATLHKEVIASHPPVMTAATKIIMDIMSIVFMTCIAFGQATATLVGQSLGARNPALAERYGWTASKLGAYVMTFIGVAMIVFPDFCTALFNPDPVVIATTRDSLRLMAASAAIMAVGMVLAQALLGAGNTVFVMKVELVLHFFCLIPATWLFGLHLEWGILGVWSAALTYVVLLGLIMAWKFREGSWKDIRI